MTTITYAHITTTSASSTATASASASASASPIGSPYYGHFRLRPSTSRGTQRLYVRINTLHFLLSHLQSLETSLSPSTSASSSASTSPAPSSSSYSPNTSSSSHRSLRAFPAFFHHACSSIDSSILHVSEVAAYRLIFADLLSHFYNSLYVYSVSGARIAPCLAVLKQSLSLLVAILTDRAQAPVVREVMKAAFEAFLMVMLAGGNTRAFHRDDYDMIEEDFENLKRLFSTSGEGLLAEEVVEEEAKVVEEIMTLMGKGTEALVEDFTRVACQAGGFGMGMGMGRNVRVPMPPTTGRWNQSDPNTVLRVLCHRNDKVASDFLKKSFQLPRRIWMPEGGRGEVRVLS